MEQPKHQVTRLLLGTAVLLYVVVFSVLGVARYDTFHATTFDLGIMTQVVWNTAHGRWFETSIDRATNVELIGSYLGNHVRPILLLLAPFYRLWPDPRLLLILQSIALGLAAVPLYWVARRKTGDPKSALVIVCCYLAYPALGFLNLCDFHPIAFSIPCLFLAYWALLEGRTALFWIAVLLALSTKEEMVVPIAAWGLVNLLQPGKRRVGLGLLALAGAWAVLCLGLIIPYFNAGRPYRFWQLWSHLPGFSAQPSVQGGTAQPAMGTSPETVILFLLHLALPLGFVPCLGPASLAVALPSLAYLLLGKRPAFHSVGYQYPAVLIPWLFLATVEGLRRLRRMASRPGGLSISNLARPGSPAPGQKRGFGNPLRATLGPLSLRCYRLGLACLLIGTLGINIPLNPILLYARQGAFRPDPYHEQIAEALALIPPESGVATVNRLGPALSNRRVLVALEYPPPLRLDHVQMADYVLLDLVDCRAVPALDQRARYAEIVTQVMHTGFFRVRYWSGRILLLERGTPTEEQLAAILAYVTDLVDQNQPCWP